MEANASTSNGFEPFLFSYRPDMQLKIQTEEEMVPAILQVEYLANTDGKLKTMCADECLKHLATDELTSLE